MFTGPLVSRIRHRGDATRFAKYGRTVAHHTDRVHLPNPLAVDLDADRPIAEQAMDLILIVAPSPVSGVEGRAHNIGVDQRLALSLRPVCGFARDLCDQPQPCRYLGLASRSDDTRRARAPQPHER